MRSFFDRHRRRFRDSGKYSLARSVFELVDGFLLSSNERTTTAPHVRDASNIQRLLNNFVIASIPCWLFGLWSVGRQIHRALQIIGAERPDGWRADLMESLGFGFDPLSIADCFVHGFLYFAPIFLIALIVGAFWEALFAKHRKRKADDGLLFVAWLYSMILPATATPLQVAFGMTVAIVLGKAIFGGAGRYLINPAVLGFAFLVFSYSNIVFGVGAWVPVPGYEDPTTIELYSDEGGIAALESVGYSWIGLFFGDQPGPFGVTSLFACLLGAAYLIVTGTASWRIMAGSVVGMIVTVWLFNAFGSTDNHLTVVPWYWHAITGGWAFGTVFLATDPVAAAQTNAGRWLFGIAIGLITIVVRVTNPGYYEGVIFAILLASIFAPLFDYAVLQRNIRRRRARTGVRA